MKKQIIILAIAALFVSGNKINSFTAEAVWQNISRENLNLRALLIGPDNPHIIYIGTDDAIFKTQDAGENWKRILGIRGQNKGVNFLLFGPEDKDSVYAATAGGLFRSANQGRNWNKIFQGKNYLENDCTALAILSDNIYLGTKAGFFFSKDRGRSWHKGTAIMGSSAVFAIACNPAEPDYIFVACSGGVFKSRNKGESWERVFAANPQDNGADLEERADYIDEEAGPSEIRRVTIDPNNSKLLYLATSRGIYISQDKGLSWQPFTNYGLLNKDARFLLVSKDSRLYAATKSGIFAYKTGRWQELSFNLAAGDIRHLALDSQNNLYAACGKGLFKAKMELSGNGANDINGITEIYYKDGPGINEVQQAAIKYAEVELSKIKEWRRKAKVKALLPKLTIGLDRSESSNYEIYTSATTKYVYEGPRDKSNGWDVTLSWELSDLIWSEAQTSIDVRSRLMVQLREDVLDEVTRLYFERLRVKMDLDNLSIEDRKKRIEKELRLGELTAMLDALSGGCFSWSN